MKKQHNSLTVFSLSMMTVAMVMSLRGLPMMAKEGLSMFFFLIFSSILFLVPVALVAAELATSWPQAGGVYLWVKKAFGDRWGFVAIWLQWVQNTVWYPSVLAYAAGCLSYLFVRPELAQNNYFVLAIVLVVYWSATLISFRGLNIAGKITSLGVILGTIVPGALIILLGVIWVCSGKPLAFMQEHQPLIPDLSSFSSVAFLASIVLLFAGMEVGAVHVKELPDPKRQFPKVILLAVLVIITVFTLGAFSIAVVIPADKISLDAGIMQGFKHMLDQFHVGWLVPVIGLMCAFGAMGGVIAWVGGPSRGLLATAKDGVLPPILHHTNSRGIQTHILVLQGSIVTIISFVVFLGFDNISTAFALVSAIAALLYLIMYVLMFAAAIRLRFIYPDIDRPYAVPGGIAGMLLVAGIGIVAVVFAFIVGFAPPAQLHITNTLSYVLVVSLAVIILGVAPLVIHAFRKPSWLPETPAESKTTSEV
jgi:putative glutamate/gamma-aminobutyrate antiporter